MAGLGSKRGHALQSNSSLPHVVLLGTWAEGPERQGEGLCGWGSQKLGGEAVSLYVVSGQALRSAANSMCLKRQNQPRVKIHPTEEFKKLFPAGNCISSFHPLKFRIQLPMVVLTLKKKKWFQHPNSIHSELEVLCIHAEKGWLTWHILANKTGDWTPIGHLNPFSSFIIIKEDRFVLMCRQWIILICSETFRD